MNKLFSLLRFTLGSMLMAGIVYIGVVYALNSWDTGYQVTSSQQKDITLQDGSCRRITNNATNRFIPTKTMAEWNAFNAVAGGQGVSVGSCAVNCSYDTYQGSSCSVSCGGGNRDTYYNITVPASGGGTCPVTQGQWAGWNGASCNTQACPINGSCGGSANSCSVGSPSGYSAGSCGGSQTWSCLGSNGGTNASCSIGNPACPSCSASAWYCNVGTATNGNGATTCNTTSTWDCSNGGSTIQCSHYNGSCPSCSASAWYCNVGTATNGNGATTCNTTSTWDCSNAGSTIQCSHYNGACLCPAGNASTTGDYGTSANAYLSASTAGTNVYAGFITRMGGAGGDTIHFVYYYCNGTSWSCNTDWYNSCSVP